MAGRRAASTGGESLDLTRGVLKVDAFIRQTAAAYCPDSLADVALIARGPFERGSHEPGDARPKRRHVFWHDQGGKN